MPAKVWFRDADGVEGLIELGHKTVNIGRAPDCPIRSQNKLVSRRHARIVGAGDSFWIEDLASANGTKVNNRRIQRQLLKHNDAVVCGSLTLRFLADAAPGAAKVAAASPVAAAPSAAPPDGRKLRESVDSLRRQLDEALRARDQAIRARDEALGARDEARKRLAQERGAREEQVATSLRLRAEHRRLQDQLERAGAEQQESARVLGVHEGLVRELRGERDAVKVGRDKARSELTEAKQRLATLARQLQRARDEAAKKGAELEKLKQRHQALTSADDARAKQLGEQRAELKKLRLVLEGQERALEERRAGLRNLAEEIKTLRSKRAQDQVRIARLRSERDELQEEKRRLARLVRSGGPAGSS